MLEDVLLTKRILALLAYIFGFAAVPIFAKTFSGALGQLLGMVNDKSKGLIDRPRNKLREFSEGRRKGRREAKWQHAYDERPSQRPLKSLNPLKRSSWKDAWNNRHRAKTNLRAGWNTYRAGGQRPNLRRMLTEPDEDKKQRYPQTALGEYMRHRAAITSKAGQGVFEAEKARIEQASERAKMELYDKSYEELERIVKGQEIVVDQHGKAILDIEGRVQYMEAEVPEAFSLRDAAFAKICEAGLDGPARSIIQAAAQAQLADKDHPLVSLVRNAKNNNKLFDGFREKAPDIAKGLIDESTGEIKILRDGKGDPILNSEGRVQVTPTARFLYENSSEDIGTKWGASTVEHIASLPDEYVGNIGGRDMSGQEIKRHILVGQSREIFTSPQLRRKSNQATVESIAKTIYESKDLWESIDSEFQQKIMETLTDRNIIPESKIRPRTVRKVEDPDDYDELDSSFLDDEQ